MHIQASVVGLLAIALSQAVAKPVTIRQDGGCIVTVGGCNDQPIDVELMPCACECLKQSCTESGGCENPDGTPFKGDQLSGAFDTCVADNDCGPLFAPDQAIAPDLINC